MQHLTVVVDASLIFVTLFRTNGAPPTTLQELPSPLQQELEPFILKLQRKSVAHLELRTSHLLYTPFQTPLEHTGSPQRRYDAWRAKDAHPKKLPTTFEALFGEFAADGEELLLLTAWFLAFTHLRREARPHQQYFNFRTHALVGGPIRADAKHCQGKAWTCPDCEESVPAGRDLCTNPSCTSWEKLARCTGQAVLRQLPKADSA